MNDISNLNLWKLLLVPPGAGVHTVSTGSDMKNVLWQKYYNTIDTDKIDFLWKNSLQQIDLNDFAPLVFGCPSDTGAGIIKGSNWGPLYLRLALPDSIQAHDIGDIKVNPHLLHDDLLSKDIVKHLQKKMYPNVEQSQSSQLPVSALSQIDFLTQAIWKINPDKKIFFLAGDHSCSYPIVKNWCQSRQHKNFAILHFDAHTDLLDERLGIPYCFATWANQILAYLPSPQHLLQVGIRASAKNQKYWEDHLKVKQIWSKDIRENSIEQTHKLIISHYKKLGIEEIYISFDVDVLDPQYLSCTGTAEKDGLYPHHIAGVLQELKEHFKVSSIDVVEFAPFIRQPHIAQAQLEPDTSMLTLKTLLPLFWNCL